MKELAEDVERKNALQDVAEVASKERAKIAATAKQKATESEKAKALARRGSQIWRLKWGRPS